MSPKITPDHLDRGEETSGLGSAPFHLRSGQLKFEFAVVHINFRSVQSGQKNSHERHQR